MAHDQYQYMYRERTYRKRSSMWNHFTLFREEGLVECNHCQRGLTYNLGGTTTNMKNHMRKLHPDKLLVDEKLTLQNVIYTSDEITIIDDLNEDDDQEGQAAFETEPVVRMTIDELRRALKQAPEESNSENCGKSSNATSAKPIIFKRRLTSDCESSNAEESQSITKKPRSSSGLIPKINQRMDRIERKLDALINFMVGEET